MCDTGCCPHAGWTLKTLLTTPTLHINKNMTQKDATARGVVGRKNPLLFCKIQGRSQTFYGVRTPTFVPCEPILLEMVAVFGFLKTCLLSLGGFVFVLLQCMFALAEDPW